MLNIEPEHILCGLHFRRFLFFLLCSVRVWGPTQSAQKVRFLYTQATRLYSTNTEYEQDTEEDNDEWVLYLLGHAGRIMQALANAASRSSNGVQNKQIVDLRQAFPHQGHYRGKINQYCILIGERYGS